MFINLDCFRKKRDSERGGNADRSHDSEKFGPSDSNQAEVEAKSEELFNVIEELPEARRGPESPKDRRGLEAKGR